MVAAREKCQHYLPHKRRRCKFDVVPGKKYCGNHLPAEEEGARRRIPCPWDPKGAQLRGLAVRLGGLCQQEKPVVVVLVGKWCTV